MKRWEVLGLALLPHGGVQQAVGQAHGDLLADAHLLGRAQDFPGPIVGDGVAALQQLKRAAFLQFELGRFKTPTLGSEDAIASRTQISKGLVHLPA